MNITSITGYTPNRQAQNVNFNGISVVYETMRDCGLTDKDISELNKSCPKDLEIDVAHSKRVAYIFEFYKGTLQEDSGFVKIPRNRELNKIRFMERIYKIFDKYREVKQGDTK